MTDYPHVPVGKLFYRVHPLDQNHNGQRFDILTVCIGNSQRWTTNGEVFLRLQTDSAQPRWYGASMQANAAFTWVDDSQNALKLAEKIRARVVKMRQESRIAGQNLECDLTVLIEVLRQLKAVHAVYDGRTSRVVGVNDVMPEGYCAWRDDWISMGRESCTFSAVARDADEARAMMVLEAKGEHSSPYYTEYLQTWMRGGAPVKQLTDSSFKMPEIRYLESFLKPQAEKAA